MKEYKIKVFSYYENYPIAIINWKAINKVDIATPKSSMIVLNVGHNGVLFVSNNRSQVKAKSECEEFIDRQINKETKQCLK